MSVDDWARREAERQFPMGRLNPGETGNVGNREYTHDGAAWMARHAFSALLSDKAVRAMQKQLVDSEQPYIPGHELYAALQAAIDAVTKEARND